MTARSRPGGWATESFDHLPAVYDRFAELTAAALLDPSTGIGQLAATAQPTSAAAPAS